MTKIKKNRLSFLTATTNLVFTVIGSILFLFVTYGVFNTGFFILSIFYTDETDNAAARIVLPILVALVGISFIGTAIFFTYKALKVYAVNLFFGQVAVVLKKICGQIVEKVKTEGTVNFGNKITDKSYKAGYSMSSLYDRKVPRFVRKGIYYVLDLIPFGSIVNDMQYVISREDKETAKEALYERVEGYVTGAVFRKDSFVIIILVFVLNLIIQGFVYLMFKLFFL